tara:strand:- start:70 stop:1062 length:993 start_codon:yes stop_codon:yes gene_type:complete
MTIRLGILGYGTMGKIYKSTIDDFSMAEISVIFSEKYNTNKENILVTKWSDLDISKIQFYTDLLDGLIITVPEWMRLEILRKALKLKVPILIDKPLASSWDETKKIKEMCENSGIPLYVCNTLIFNPIYRNLFERVKNKECGEIGFISSSRDSSLERKKRIENKIFEGYWLAPHDIGFTLDLLNKVPSEIYCGFREDKKQLSFNYELYFENGIVSRFESCYALRSNINAGNLSTFFRIVGEKSTLEAYDNSINLNSSNSWLNEYPDLHEWHNTIALNRGYLGSPAIDFAIKIKEGEKYKSLNHTLEKSILIQKIIHKLNISSSTSKRILI